MQSCIQQFAITNAAVSQVQSIPILQRLLSGSHVRIAKSHSLAKAVDKCLKVQAPCRLNIMLTDVILQ